MAAVLELLVRSVVYVAGRLRHKPELSSMLDSCKEARADILVLTETDTQIHPEYRHCYQTPPAKEVIPDLYKETENRVSIRSCLRVYIPMPERSGIITLQKGNGCWMAIQFPMAAL